MNLLRTTGSAGAPGPALPLVQRGRSQLLSLVPISLTKLSLQPLRARPSANPPAQSNPTLQLSFCGRFCFPEHTHNCCFKTTPIPPSQVLKAEESLGFSGLNFPLFHHCTPCPQASTTRSAPSHPHPDQTSGQSPPAGAPPATSGRSAHNTPFTCPSTQGFATGIPQFLRKASSRGPTLGNTEFLQGHNVL